MEFRVLAVRPAEIDVNFEEVKANLTETMEKYKGYVVTEDNLSLCKATQKELAGVRIKIDEFRKTQKKALSAPIDRMESQCKELIKLVEDAEAPIKEGIKAFDDLKREEKRTTAEILIKHAINKFELNAKYASQLTVNDKYTNLTAKEKEVAEDIEIRAGILKEQQNREAEMLEIVQDTIEHANKSINAKLCMADFQRLINTGTSTKEIIQEINSRAERTRKAEEQAEAEKALREQQTQAELQQEQPPVQQVETQAQTQQEAQNINPDMYFIELRFTGTMDQVKSVSAFLNDNNINYKVLGKGKVD